MKVNYKFPYMIAATLFGAAYCMGSTKNTSDNQGYTISTGRDSATVTANADSTTAIVDTTMFTPRAIYATNSGKYDVMYTMNDSAKVLRTGGTRAWRNMNPGNIVMSEFSRRNGAIGRAGQFAVFPDEETGFRALCALLRTDTYGRLTINAALARYCPDTRAIINLYRRGMKSETGLNMNTRLRDLSNEQILVVANAIKKLEGWRPGQEHHVSAPTNRNKLVAGLMTQQNTHTM